MRIKCEEDLDVCQEEYIFNAEAEEEDHVGRRR